MFQIKQNKLKNRSVFEKGRSMVEILGVLAIIAVLTITGVAGYRLAMTKYRTNETVSELQMRAYVHAQQLERKGEIVQTDMGNFTRMGYGIEARLSEQNKQYFEILLNNVPLEVCRDILQMPWKLPSAILIDGKADCGKQNPVPEMIFQFPSTVLEGAGIIPPKEEVDPNACLSDSDCSVCSRCVKGQCQAGCGDKKQCYHNACVEAVCASDKDCAGNLTAKHCQIYSNPASNKCVLRECSSNNECPTAKPYCSLGAGDKYGKCVECLTHDDCPYGFCDTDNAGGGTCQRPQNCNPTTQYMNQKYCENYCENVWSDQACCPVDITTLKDQNSCSLCDGQWAFDACHPADFCESEVLGKNTATKWVCEKCGGMYDEVTKMCVKLECRRNADCKGRQYCTVGNDTDNYKGNYQLCQNLSTISPTSANIVFKGQNENWIISQNPMRYWNAVTWCEAHGKSLQSRDTIYQRWFLLGSLGDKWQSHVFTSTQAKSAAEVYTVNLRSGYTSPIARGRDESGGIRALCR